MEFRDLSLNDITRGFTESESGEQCMCIFCGKSFEEGIIYNSRDRQVNARRAAKEHIFDAHGGVFRSLIDLDKQVSGLSETQKDILWGLYEEKDNRELAEELGITAATVRTHKFNIQKMKREAKIFLAILEQLENEELIAFRKKEEEETSFDKTTIATSPDFTGNTLHPFFTVFDLK